MTINYWESAGWLPVAEDNVALLTGAHSVKVDFGAVHTDSGDDEYFDADSGEIDEVIDFVDGRGWEDGQPDHGVGTWTAYADPSGANLVAVETEKGERLVRYSLRAEAGPFVLATPMHYGLQEIGVLEGFDILAQFLVTPDDPLNYWQKSSWDQCTMRKGYRLSGFAQDVCVYPSVEAWLSSAPRAEFVGLPGPVPPERTARDEDSLARVYSPWHAERKSGAPLAPGATSLSYLRGTCTSDAVLETNELTGRQWYRVEVECNAPFTLALPPSVEPVPARGSVVEGAFFLAGSTGSWYGAVL